MTLPHDHGIEPLDPPSLLASLDAEIVRHCPEACPFIVICSTDMQVGTAMLFRSGRYQSPEDCWRWEILAKLVQRDLRLQQVPATADLLLEAMAKVRTGLPANAGDAWEGA